MADKKTTFIKKYTALVSKLQRYPSQNELAEIGLPRAQVNHYFGSTAKLMAAAKKDNPAIFDLVFSSDDFTPANLRKSKQALKEVTEFIICTAVSNCDVFEDALLSIETWMDVSGGIPIFQPIQDPAHTRVKNEDGKVVVFFDPRLKDYQFVWSDLNLNQKVKLSKILLSAKQLNPHAGLERIADNTGLTVVASPKRRLTPCANMGEFPGYIVSGGAITLADYTSDLYMSNRTADLSAAEHKLGGVWVKLLGKNKYEFTLIEFDKKDGHFTLDGVQYYPGGKTVKVAPELITFGDLHAEELTPEMINTSTQILSEKKPKKLDLHDVFTGVRCSPFTSRKPELQYMEMKEYRQETVQSSLRFVAGILNSYAERVNEVNIIDSNHHKFLEIWITKGNYRNGDPRDIVFAHQLAASWTANPHVPILKLAFDLVPNCKLSSKIKFHDGYTSLQFMGIERSQHGHIGAGGKRNPSFLKLGQALGGKSNTGHTHKSQIIGEIWSAGTFCGVGPNRPGYARAAPSDWAQTYIETYADGQRNLVHIV